MIKKKKKKKKEQTSVSSGSCPQKPGKSLSNVKMVEFLLFPLVKFPRVYFFPVESHRALNKREVSEIIIFKKNKVESKSMVTFSMAWVLEFLCVLEIQRRQFLLLFWRSTGMVGNFHYSLVPKSSRNRIPTKSKLSWRLPLQNISFTSFLFKNSPISVEYVCGSSNSMMPNRWCVVSCILTILRLDFDKGAKPEAWKALCRSSWSCKISRRSVSYQYPLFFIIFLTVSGRHGKKLTT